MEQITGIYEFLRHYIGDGGIVLFPAMALLVFGTWWRNRPRRAREPRWRRRARR